MLRHIVLLELRPETPLSTIDEIVQALRELPAKIEQIRSFEVTVDIGLAEGNATLGIVAGFDDADAWREYGPHPEHQAVVQQLITPNVLRRSAVQGTPLTV